MVELSHGLFRSSLYANLGLKVEQVAKSNNIFPLSVSRQIYFHEPIGVKEPGFENRRTFSKKAREPQNHYAKQ